ncbi:MAG: hypothetical protein IT190_07790, partial [Microbacteriaceae bacterium]|nr:hypothetical protein [Microbacteriaceae bacterium]
MSSLESTAELPFIDIDLGLRNAIRFSYSRPEDPLLKKALICGIEKLSGQSYLQRRYHDWSARG